VRSPQFPMGSLLGHGRLNTTREVGYTPGGKGMRVDLDSERTISY
jgi:hypothetical protein